MPEQPIDEWFMRDVLPLEPMLTRFLRRNWRNEAEISDLRQEAYARIYESARRERPLQIKPFLFQIARNLMIDRLRKFWGNRRRSPSVSIQRLGWRWLGSGCWTAKSCWLVGVILPFKPNWLRSLGR